MTRCSSIHQHLRETLIPVAHDGESEYDEQTSPTSSSSSPERMDSELPRIDPPSPPSALSHSSPSSSNSPTGSSLEAGTTSSLSTQFPHVFASRSPSKLSSSQMPQRPTPTYTRPHSPVPSVQPRLRPRGLGLTPLNTAQSNTSHPTAPIGSGQLPKSQPLSRALFAKKVGNDVPHAGLTGTGRQEEGCSEDHCTGQMLPDEVRIESYGERVRSTLRHERRKQVVWTEQQERTRYIMLDTGMSEGDMGNKS